MIEKTPKRVVNRRRGFILLFLLLILGSPSWAQDPNPLKPLKLPELVIIGEDPTVLKGRKERLEPEEFWFDPEAVKREDKEEIISPAVLSWPKEVPWEKKPSWIYNNPLITFFLKLLAREKTYYKIGLYKFKEGRLEEAINQWQSLVEGYRYGRFQEKALYWLAEAHYRLKEYDQAKRYLQRFIENYPYHIYLPYAYLSLGYIELEQGNYPAAEKDFSLAIESTSQNKPELLSLNYLFRGLAQYLQDKFEPASLTFGELREKAPPGPLYDVAIFLQAESLYYAHDYEGAQTGYQDYIREVPQGDYLQESYYGLGWSQLNQGNWPGALDSWEKIREDSPFGQQIRGSLLVGRIKAYIKMGRLQQAKDLLARFRTQYPDDTDWLARAAFELVLYHLREKSYHQAIRLLEQILQDYPDTNLKAVIIFLLGECYNQLGQYQEALEYYRLMDEVEKGLPPYPSLKEKALLRAGMTYYKMAEYRSAIETLEEFLRRYPESSLSDEANFWLAESHFQEEEFTQALQAYGAISIQSKKADYATYGKAWILYRAEKWTEAALLFEKLLNHYPDSPLVYGALLRLGECYYNLKKYDRAEDYFLRLAQWAPQSDLREEAIFRLAWIRYKRGNYEEARQAFEHLIHDYPSSKWRDDAQYWLAMSYFLEKDYPRARQELREVVQRYPQSPYLLQSLLAIGDSYYNEGNYDLAQKTYQEIVDNFPSHPQRAQAEYALLQTLLQQNQLERFLSLSKDFSSHHPHHPLTLALLYQVAEQYLGQGEEGLAKETYRKILEGFGQDPEADRARYQLGELEFKAKNYAQAIIHYRHLLKDYPRSSWRPQALFKTALSKFYLKSYQEAYEDWSSFVANYPQHELIPEALYYMGYCQYQLDKGDNAVSYYQRVVKSFSNHPYIYKCYLELGRISFDQGRLSKAKDWLLKATVGPDKAVSAQAFLILGDLYNGLGQPRKAIEEYLKVAYLYPEQKELFIKSLFRAAHTYEGMKRWPESLKLYRKIARETTDPKLKKMAQEKVKELVKRIERPTTLGRR